MRRSSVLPSVLAAADLPSAELQAARLDGELYPLAEAYCPIGELEGPAHRARSVLAHRSPRLIAELHTAAWIWGATPQLGFRRFAVAPDARARLSPDQHAAVREVVYEPGDVAELGEVRVTTPLRTALDLARFAETFDRATVTRLLAICGRSPADAVAELDRRPGIPFKSRAKRRLREPGGDQPVDTR